jgi:biopolymer transport protein ExbD
MKILIIIVFFISCLFTCCQEVSGQKKTVHVFCDNFPELKINLTVTDTSRLKEYVQNELAQNQHDSLYFVIECPDNIVYENVIQTDNMLKRKISLLKNEKSKIVVYDKCLNELFLPSQTKDRKLADVTIRADIRGDLFYDNKPVTLDLICEKYRGQNITIEISADKDLTIDKFSAILKRLEKEKFKVILAR